ncbi:MAG: dethiobiotin synthase [Rhodobacterales bacterium]|nr:dethiobiotin synthase [Rhodobacterales bacterium]NCO86335.1 dethiobiotin synthase [Rhodobacterales bacterium]
MTQDVLAPLTTAKWTFATRRVDHGLIGGMDTAFAAARPGDLILAQVESLGQHQRVQLSSGRPSYIYPGDMIVLACGARYAPDQFEGLAEIDPDGADLLAGGGCIGRMVARNERIKNATRLLPVGRLLDDAGEPVNLDRFALPPTDRTNDIPVVFVLGTAMNSGKTLATAQLALGLRRAGYKVAALKGTGTGAFGDFNEYSDTGAHWVADFTDAGMVTTYREPLARVKDGLNLLLGHAAERGCDIAVMEIADGLFQRETGALVADPWLRDRLSGLVFACGDAVAAAGGVAELARHGLRPDALTGILSCSPMAAAEAMSATGVPVLRKGDLADPAEANVFALRAFAGTRRAA